MSLLMDRMKPPIQEIGKDLGSAIRAIRGEKGLTQSELASISGIRRTHLAGIEGEGRNITMESLAKLSGALMLKPSDLLARAHW